MALVGASTAWEECRIALGAAILHHYGVTVSGSDWWCCQPNCNPSSVVAGIPKLPCG